MPTRHTNTHTLNLNVSPAGSGSVTGAGEYAEGTTVTITATPNANYHFVNWSGDTDHIADATAAGTTLTMPAQNISLTANFVEGGGGNGEPGEGVTDIDGNFYPSVIIGSQEWMAENLRTTTFADGSPIDFGINIENKETTTTPAYAIYNFPIGEFTEQEIFDMFGALYNWPAVDDPRGLCPVGWEVPSQAQWDALISYLASTFEMHNDMYSSDNKGVGNALKSCRQVNSPLGEACNTSEHPRWDAHPTHFGNDLIGFNGLPAGSISNLAHSMALESAWWWSSTSINANEARAFYLFIETGALPVAVSSKYYGLSVRCVRDVDAPATHTLNLNASPEDSGEVTGAGNYEAGEEVTITATPNANYHFVNWTGDTDHIADAYAASTTLTMPAQNITLTANFEEDGGGNIQPGAGVTDIDGNFYPSVIIGNQEWMAENLRVTQYNNGDAIPTGLDNTEWGNTTDGAYAIYPHSQIDGLNSDEEVVEAYGKLYNWYTVDDAHGLCPAGWRVPTDADWTALTDYVVAQGYPNSSVVNGAGDALKNCRQVNHPDGGECDTSEHPRWNSNNTHSGFDEFGFSALPGGRRWSDGVFGFAGSIGYWWSDTEFDAAYVWYRHLLSAFGGVGLGYSSKRDGFSIRCLRDTSEPTTFSLNLNISPAGSGEVSGAGNYEAGEEVTITATPNANYHFVNWTGDTDHIADASAASTTLTMPAQNITLTANFVEDSGGNGQPGAGVTDIDGNFYPSVIIGNQEWMAENLRVTRDANGNDITRYCYNNDAANCDLYGGLYTWHTVMNGATSSNTNPSNVQGICPTGWHVPSDAEWTELVDYVVAQGYPNSNVVNGAGNALKSCRQVSSPLGGDCATSEHPRWNSNNTHYGTDEFGFSALPGGSRGTYGGYYDLGYNGFWWSSTENSTTDAWFRNLNDGNGFVVRYYSNKVLGISVRCFRDAVHTEDE